ncbi:MAG: choice-of-anchor D domain-containing protein [Deltaproteobacteria bacterium]|nr:choice-of-anchor D domain-containing protein [Deltaproteobacteria bacterium]
MRRISHIVLPMLLCAACSCSGNKKATSVPASLQLDPSSLEFHVVALGAGSPLTLTLNAQTAAPVILSSATVSDSGDGSASAFTLSNVPSQVPANGSATLTVTFSPTAVRSYAATLTVKSDDADRPTQTITLTGSGGARAVSVTLEDPSGATAILGDGGSSIDFQQPPGGTSGIAWPEVLMSNTGLVAANLTGFSFANGDAGFFLPTVPTLPQVLGPEQTKTLEVAFAPPTGNTASHLTDALTLTFDDPLLPQATISLAAEVTPNHPPVACAYVQSAQELDGTINVTDGGSVPPIEPGSLVQFTAFSTDFAPSVTPGCSSDTEDPPSALALSWSITSAPAGSHASLQAASTAHPMFMPDVPGAYDIGLRVQDTQGASATADVQFTAAPLEDVTVKLLWPNQPLVDLDLHLVRPGGRLFQVGDDVSSLLADAGHDWGTPNDPTDDPHFSGDDVGDGALQESVWLDRPQDGCLGDGGCSYGVWVHYFQDRRAEDGGSCGTSACFEGTACGCAGTNEVCEPGASGGSCAAEVAPQVAIYLKGQIAPAVSVPLDTLLLPSPCFTWHALDLSFFSDGGLGPVSNPGDGGDIEYWGDHTNAIRECAPGAGGYAPTSPPLLTP